MNDQQIPTPRTRAAIVEVQVAFEGLDGLSSATQSFVHPEIAETLEREAIALREQVRELSEKLDFLKSKGLTVGKMKTSDKPEPYLVYVCESDSEFDDTIHIRKLVDAEIQRDLLKDQLATCQQERDQAKGRLAEAVQIMESGQRISFEGNPCQAILLGDIEAFLEGETASGWVSVNGELVMAMEDVLRSCSISSHFQANELRSSDQAMMQAWLNLADKADNALVLLTAARQSTQPANPLGDANSVTKQSSQ